MAAVISNTHQKYSVQWKDKNISNKLDNQKKFWVLNNISY